MAAALALLVSSAFILLSLFLNSLSLTSAFPFTDDDGSPSSPPHQPRIGVIFNSSSTLQYNLYLAAWMGFRDTLPDESDKAQPPHVLDVAQAGTFRSSASWLVGNQTQRLVSLLEPDQLLGFFRSYEQFVRAQPPMPVFEPLMVVLPRECVHVHIHDREAPRDTVAPFRVKCLQLNHEAMAEALIHRAAKVGVTRLLPMSLQPERGNQNAVDLNRIYKEALHRHRQRQTTGTPGGSLKLASIAFDLNDLKTEIKFQNKVATLRNESSTNEKVLGVLILDRDPGTLEQILETITSVHEPTRLIYTFTPWGIDAMLDDKLGLAKYLKELPYVNRLYTVVGTGIANQARNFGDSERMRILSELNEFIGPSPFILTAVAAYDAAMDLVKGQAKSLTKKLESDQGVLYGISPKPVAAIAASDGVLLQPSDFILEDIHELAPRDDGSLYVTNYHVATSSIISRHDLTTLADEAEVRINCSRPLLKVTSYDPFNRQPYVYGFGTSTGSDAGDAFLPNYLLIPNLYGYGLELECVHVEKDHAHATLVTNLRIACTPTSTVGGDSVNCYRSNWNHRVKRSELMMQRDDKGNPMGEGVDEASYYQQNQPYMNMADVHMTTSMPEPEPLPSSPPPPPHSTHKPPPPPPDLRQVIKAAKPFMGGCIGSSIGCATCVLILGRLPIFGLSPAFCSGPCFAGVFGQCGALLGRVGSETTIICTELFRQGYLDVETFMADAEFGRRMAETAPVTVRGYRLLATPVVHAMRASPGFTEVVAYAAKPWAKYMKTLVGRVERDSRKDEPSNSSVVGDSEWIGAWIHSVGVPICTIVGHLASGSDQATWVIAVVGLISFVVTRRRKS